MAKVLGIGGVFFKARDPQAVRDWYARVLGFDVNDWGGVIWPHPATGHGNWSVFAADSDYYAPSTAPFMVNYIVDDLEGVLAKARAAGAEPVGEPVSDDYGRFGWLMDPAGVKIELWEPPPTPQGNELGLICQEHPKFCHPGRPPMRERASAPLASRSTPNGGG